MKLIKRVCVWLEERKSLRTDWVLWAIKIGRLVWHWMSWTSKHFNTKRKSHDKLNTLWSDWSYFHAAKVTFNKKNHKKYRKQQQKQLRLVFWKSNLKFRTISMAFMSLSKKSNKHMQLIALSSFNSNYIYIYI